MLARSMIAGAALLLCVAPVSAQTAANAPNVIVINGVTYVKTDAPPPAAEPVRREVRPVVYQRKVRARVRPAARRTAKRTVRRTVRRQAPRRNTRLSLAYNTRLEFCSVLRCGVLLGMGF